MSRIAVPVFRRRSCSKIRGTINAALLRKRASRNAPAAPSATAMRGVGTQSRPPAAKAQARRGRLAGDDEIDGLDVESDALALHQRLEARAFNGSYVHEHVTAAIVGFDEAVAALTVEKFDRTGHCHCITPSRACVAAAMEAGGKAGHSHEQRALAPTASATPPAPTGGGTAKPSRNKAKLNRS